MAEKSVGHTNPAIRYLQEVRGELRKVTWPTREESWRLTGVVLVVTIAFAIFLWVFDYFFSSSVEILIRQIVGI